MSDSPVLSGLFGPGVAIAEGPVRRHQGALMAAEEPLAARMAPGRRAQFHAGRTLARAALARLGRSAAALGRAEGGAPIWPAGIVGSITHCGDGLDGWCAVAVAEASRLRSIGLDAEQDEPLDESLRALVLLPSEARATNDDGRLAMILFSAKESVYKALHPLTGMFLEFADVEVRIDPETDAFTARVRKRGWPSSTPRELSGRWRRQEGLITTAVELPAANADRRPTPRAGSQNHGT